MSNEEDPSKTITRSQGPCTAEEPMTDEENQEQLEREERKERLRKKEKAFFKEIRKSEAMSGLQPLGIDRGFRRYWLFNSINGLFIEDNDSELSKLLQPKVIDEVSYCSVLKSGHFPCLHRLSMIYVSLFSPKPWWFCISIVHTCNSPLPNILNNSC